MSGQAVFEVYLDNCATTRPCQEAVDAALNAMQTEYGNPASLHYFGARAYQHLGVARSQVAQILGAATDEIIFTSGATEANNLAILGAMRAEVTGGHFVTAHTEHAAVLQVARHLEEVGHPVTYVVPDAQGNIPAQAVAAAVRPDTVMVSVAGVNNETGTVAPLRDIVAAVKSANPNTLVHTDYVQGFGKLPLKVWDIKVDLLSLSGHKIHAPKGVGALYVRSGVQLQPLLYGGSQEQGLRPGTENVPFICALGAAAHKALGRMQENLAYVAGLWDRLATGLQGMPGVHINSPAGASPYILNLSVAGHETDAMVTAFSLQGVTLSGGAACSRGAQSHVLQAMGLPPSRVRGALRVGLSTETLPRDIDRFLAVLKDILGGG